MGAGAGAAAAIESEPSPRRAAIEKAPAELRRELALREERRRELEFLEKGGELLDFYRAPWSAVPSSSLADPVAGQLMSSEAEGGYALIAQANVGSLENSLGTSSFGGRDSEGGDHHARDDVASTASESQTLAWEVKYRAPRTGSGSVRSHSDVNLKREMESSGIGRVGTQSQAYSRRNRQRSNRFGNGYTAAREVDRIVDGNASPSVEGRGPSAPPIVSVEVCKGIENMVEKIAQQLPVHGLPSTSGNRVGLGNSKATDNLDGSNIQIVKWPDLQPPNNVSPLDACASQAKLPSNCGLIITDCVAAGRYSDVKDGMCTDISVTEDLPTGSDLNKSDHVLLTPCLEESLGARAGGAVSQPLKQSLSNSRTASDKEVSLPVVVKNETSVMMVREKSSVSGHLSPHGARSEWKNKLSASQPQRAMDRGTGIPSNLLPDFTTIVPNMDDKRFVKLGVADPVQVTSKSFDSSEHRSNATRKTTSTASSGALEISKGELVLANEKLLGSARVEVKIEEGFSEVGTGQSAADTEVESGHDVKSTYKISLPKEEVKSEGQTTPVSQGSNRTGFRTPSSLAASNKFPGVVLPWEKEKDPSVIAEAERHKADLSAKAKRAHEDYIIEEAEIIKTGKRDSAEWGRRRPEQEPVRRKSHWDFVLEEMAWMANDFMQERLWKVAAASQTCRWIAQKQGQLEFRGKDVIRRQKKVAHVLANAVNEFWRSIELTMHKERVAPVDSREQEQSTMVKDDSNAGPKDADIPAATEISGKPLLQQQLSKKSFPIQSYAKSFLLESLGVDVAPQAEGPTTPARVSEASSVLDPLWEDQFAEEALCYTVPNGAFASYRSAVETQRALLEADYEQKLQEQAAVLAEAEAQAAAEAIATADFIAASADDGQSLGHLSSPTQGVRTDEDGTQYGLLHSSVSKKKRKNILKSNSVKMEGLPHAVLSRPMTFHNFDSGGGLPSPLVTGKRSLPAGTTPTSANVGVIPTKRMRSGTSRQRLGTASPSAFPSPAGLMSRTTFSSGALNSNHEEVHNMPECPISARAENDAAGAAVGKNILGGGDGSPFPNSKSKKKKKTKHFIGALGTCFKTDGSASRNTGSTLNPVESDHHSVYDQKRKGDLQHGGSLETSAGGIGSSAETSETPLSQGQQPLKKAKLSKQTSDINSEGATAVVTLLATQPGSMVANTSGTSKLLRQNSNRDRNRKGRTNKVSVGQPAGIGIPWSTIEDQAILALVHDLGPNWELVSDVLSSSSQLKGIFRRPKQCKERHKALMDRLSVGEGGESPEDPSTSQPHPSTLPGIPKGSARVLLQRLQGPAEEDTLKVHLEHIVRVVHKSRSLKPQVDEQKVLAAPHPSHMNAVSQFCNSGAAGGFPTPLELCDLSAANTELGSPSYQMPGQPMPGILPPGSGIRPATNGMPVLPGASNAHMGVPAMAPSNAAVNAARDVHRLVAMRPFSPEEAQRVRYARAMAAARGLPVPGPPVTAGLPIMPLSNPNDVSVPMLPVGNNVGLMGGLSRGMSLSRAGMPGMGSPGVSGMGSPTLGTMLPPGGVGMVGAGPSVGSVGVPNQFNLVRRPRDQMVRPPTRTSEEQRQIQFQELQHQAAQGNPEPQTTLTGMNRDLLNPLIPAAPQSFSSQQLQNQHQNHLLRHQQFQNQQQHKQRMFQQQLQQPTSRPSPLQLHSMPPQQHVLPQQSLVAQHQHLLPQQHSLQKQQTQQGLQQPVLPLPSSPIHPMASPPLPPNHQQHQTLSQSQSQQPLQPSGQVPQLSVQSKLQQPKQLQKHQHLHQSSQALQQQQSQQPQQQQHQHQHQQQQQQQPRGSKGVARGNMVLQPGQSNMLPGNVALANQLSQQISGQAISHSVPGPRSLQLQVPISMGKQPSPGTPGMMTGQGGQMQAQQNLASPGSSVPASAGQQQKVLQQQSQVPSATKQQQVSPPVHSLHAQQSSPTPGQSNQQQLSPPFQQSQIVPPQQGQPRRQSQQPPHVQLSGQQRRLQQRQPGSSVGGVPGASQLSKTGSSHQGHISSQVPTQPGHGTYPMGTNMAGSSLIGTSTTNPLIPPGVSSGTSGVHSTQWKPGQSVSSMSTGMYNLTRSGSLGVAPMSSGTSTPGMHIAYPNGGGTSMSSSNTHGMSTGAPQVGSGLQGQKAGVLPGAISRAGTGTAQGGAQRSSQQHQGNVGMSIPVGAAGQVKPPVPASPGGIMPVSMLGPSTAAGVPHSGSMTFPGTSVAVPGHSAALPNSIPMFGVQPRQSHAGSAAMNSSAVLQKSSAPTTVNAGSSSASAGSSDLVKSPGTVANSTGADQSISS